MLTDAQTSRRVTARALLLGASLCALQLLTAACAGSGTADTDNAASGGGNAANTPRAAASPAASPAAAQKGFTEAEVAEIKSLLNDVDPSGYRVTLPEFRDGAPVGTMTLGTLPLTEVRRIASARGVQVDESTPKSGTIILVLSAPTTGGGTAVVGRSAESVEQSPRGGSTVFPAERIQKLEAVLSRIDQSQYVFIR